ncbi:MAG: GtrA family protein [Chloroflexi bacterium]|nr:GtrA family protein [Chloroflexota bacterium]
MSKLLGLVSYNQSELSRFAKFAIVGGFGALVDFGVLNLMILAFSWPKFIANLFSVSCAIVSNFVWNRYWTFPESRERTLHSQFGQFAAVNLVGLVINEVIFLGLDAVLFSHLFHPPVDYNMAKATAVVVVLFWNFGANRRWTYRGI